MNCMKEKSIIKFVDRECSVASLCRICEQIREILEYLNVDLSPETNKNLSQLT